MTSEDRNADTPQSDALARFNSVMMAIVGTLLSVVTSLYAIVEHRPEYFLLSFLLWALVAVDPDIGRWRHVWD